MLLRLVDEFKIRSRRTYNGCPPAGNLSGVESAASCHLGPLDAFAYKVELKHENWRNIRHLLESGVQYGLMTDHPVTPAQQIFLQTRWFLRCGLSRQRAIELVSRGNAEILGIDHLIGTLEKGRWASFICWKGDPFDLESYPAAVYGEGDLLFLEQ
jgi:imidazolonepropionase-like amidohydrolase